MADLTLQPRRKVSTPYTPSMNTVHLILLKQGMGVEERDVEEGAEQTLKTLERGDTGAIQAEQREVIQEMKKQGVRS